MSYDVEVHIVEAVPLAVVRREVEPGGVGSSWRSALDLVWAFVRSQHGLWAGGHNVFVYHRPEKLDNRMTVEFGVQVTRPFDGNGEVESSETPPGRVARIVHVGSIDGLGKAYAALDAWLLERGEEPAGVSWETYGDWTEDPAANETWLTYLLR